MIKISIKFLLFIILALILFVPLKASADTSCTSAYGATCPSGQLFIEKKVQNPKTGEFVNSLSSNDAVFSPDQAVNFRIEVKNTGPSALTNVSVSDRLPGNINFISANPAGSFDQTNMVLNWTIDNLGVGESKFFQVSVQVKPQSQLQSGTACMTNFVQAQQAQQAAQANAAFCVQAQVAQGAPLAPVVPAVKELPRTGLPAGIMVISASFILLGLGLGRFNLSWKNVKEGASYIYQKRKYLREGGERQ